MMMKRTIVGLSFALFASIAAALPTVQQVEGEVKQGNYAHAETMMSEVVAAKPGSARAHYFYAEILAHNANFARATEETAKARQLDPQLSFTDPEKFRSFEQLLQRQANPPAKTRAAPVTQGYAAPASSPAMTNEARPSGGIPGWVWLAGLAVLAVVVWKMFSRRPAASPAGNFAAAGMPANNVPGSGGAMGGGPMGGGMPYGGGVAPGGAGGGLLRTGLAVGAGVAGGMLIDQMLHNRSEGGASAAGLGNLGGVDPDSYDPAADSAARELENRPMDFGQGGNDWDSGGASGDSGSDGGGSWD